MKVKASKVMAKAIGEWINGTNIEGIERVTLNEREYFLYVDAYTYAHDNDYDIRTNSFQALKVTYKPECYASNKYITTNDLMWAFRHSDKTYNGFMDSVIDMLAI